MMPIRGLLKAVELLTAQDNKCVLGSVNASRKDFETGIYRLQRMSQQYPNVLKGILSDRLALDEVPKLDFKKTRNFEQHWRENGWNALDDFLAFYGSSDAGIGLRVF